MNKRDRHGHNGHSHTHNNRKYHSSRSSSRKKHHHGHGHRHGLNKLPAHPYNNVKDFKSEKRYGHKGYQGKNRYGSRNYKQGRYNFGQNHPQKIGKSAKNEGVFVGKDGVFRSNLDLISEMGLLSPGLDSGMMKAQFSNNTVLFRGGKAKKRIR